MEKYQDNFELEELAYINRNKRLMYIGIPFALIYCNMFFIWMNYSWMFCVVTSLFLIAACL